MKKLVFSFIGIAAIAVAMALNANINLSGSSSLSDLALANVEALAQTEGGSGIAGCCPNGGYCIVVRNGQIVYEAPGEYPCVLN